MTYQARPGDVILLCSDGLTTMLDEQRIAGILAGSTDLDAAVSRLIDEANERGGPRQHHRRRAAARGGERRRGRRRRQATLIGPAAAEAGLTAERVAAARAASAAGSRALRCRPRTAPLAGAAGARRAGAADRRRRRRRGLVRQPAGLLPRHRRRGPGGALPRPALRPPFVDRALRRGATRARSRSPRCRAIAATRRPTTSCARRTTPSRCSRTSRTRPRAAEPAASGEPAAGGQQGGGSRAAASSAEADGHQSEEIRRRGAAVSARNRELLALMPVALLVTAGLTAVFIVRSDGRRPQPDLRRLLPRASASPSTS